MKKVKVGVLGAGRGSTMMKYCEQSDNAELVAVCDSYEPFLRKIEKELNDPGITYYTSFDEFIQHDFDAVVLANYANEHAPYAIKCLQNNKHVISEVLPVQTLSEAVALVEAVESSDKIYAYAENYCYMPAPKEMKRLFKEGALGEFEYGEGEYMHNCERIWPSITQGNPNHWRNNMHAMFYCTHSLGPILHITGLRPVKVTGFELPFNARGARTGAKTGAAGIEMVTLENGAVVKSLHGCTISKDSIWYSIYGSKGRMESSREDAECGAISRIYINCDENDGDNNSKPLTYEPKDELSEKASGYGHGNSDYYTMYNFIEKIRGNKETDVIDVYEALNMGLCGLMAYRSVLQGGAALDVPDMRDKAIREIYRNDHSCTDPKKAGEQCIPSYSKGNPEIPMEIYDKVREDWLCEMAESEKKAAEEK